ncbi:MAG: translational GTPase TypA [Deltaproteobacteria bacterium]|nr:translational GTPase TypA [Deltaproteobacteria bacterium]
MSEGSVRRTDLRNIAIIAHVDHGKTTLVDAMLKQAGTFKAHEATADRMMDKLDQERERGITIMAKNTGILLGPPGPDQVRVNIVDTPGHADFGGEVERTLHMVDGVLLLVDAAEGPLPQTRFVLKKALGLKLVPIVVINKVDRADARPAEVLQKVYDLFIDLGADEHQLDFPVIYAVARDGWAVRGPAMGAVPEVALLPAATQQHGKLDLGPLFDTIVEAIPPPEDCSNEPLQILVNAIDYDDYVGRLALGRVHAGKVEKKLEVVRLSDGAPDKGKVVGVYLFEGMKRIEVERARAGDLICIAGLQDVVPGDTIVTPEGAGALPRISVGEPTLAMIFSVNDGPFAGRDGKYVTSRHLRDRLRRELRGNVSIRVEDTDTPDKFKVLGRGELQLAVLIEAMRRESYEMCVSRPEVVVKEIEGAKKEPLEGLVVNIPETAVGPVTELVGKRGGRMVNMDATISGWTTVEYEIPTRGLIGFLGTFRTITRGEGQMSTFLKDWVPFLGNIEARASGAMISTDLGKTTPYAIFNLQPRGVMFVGPGEEVYEGMVVGEHARDNDLDINIIREKKLTNVRAAGRDENIILTPAKRMRLEEAMEWIDMDELIEVTPTAIRIRKRGLKPHDRPKKKKVEDEEE